jgi:hypothetical protein
MGFVGALHSLRSFRRRLPWALGFFKNAPLLFVRLKGIWLHIRPLLFIAHTAKQRFKPEFSGSVNTHPTKIRNQANTSLWTALNVEPLWWGTASGSKTTRAVAVGGHSPVVGRRSVNSCIGTYQKLFADHLRRQKFAMLRKPTRHLIRHDPPPRLG